jgi:putative addiction module component (TIGR02574 family)
MSPRDAVLQQALNLSEDDRAYVAVALEQSLSLPDSISEEAAAAWSQEINRRLAAYDRGETTAIGFEESLEHMRQALAEHRARQRSERHERLARECAKLDPEHEKKIARQQ